MGCANCERLGRPCVTSSIDRLDKTIDDLADKVQKDKQELSLALDKIQEIRARIARNEKVMKQENRRLDQQIAHAVENLGPTTIEDFSEVISAESGVLAAGFPSPFDWNFASSSAAGDTVVPGSSS